MTPDNPRLTTSLLYLDDVKVTFDGYRALRGLSLVLGPGEMRAIIGPNGAGKTTMMDVITGKTRPDTICTCSSRFCPATSATGRWFRSR